MFRLATILAAVFIYIALAPNTGAAADRSNARTVQTGHADWNSMNLSTDQLFGMWRHINHSLVAIAETMSGDKKWIAALTGMRAANHTGTKPADMMHRLDKYRDKLDRLRHGARLTPTVIIERDGETPSVSTIYLNSGYLLNSQVEWLIHRTPYNYLIGNHYTPENFRGRTPNDVFALIDLADRRLDRILARAGS